MVGSDENIMISSISVKKIQGIADAINKSTAGTAQPSKRFEALVARIKPAKK